MIAGARTLAIMLIGVSATVSPGSPIARRG
jgi:hypothetical protein